MWSFSGEKPCRLIGSQDGCPVKLLTVLICPVARQTDEPKADRWKQEEARLVLERVPFRFVDFLLLLFFF